jgi:phospholipase C
MRFTSLALVAACAITSDCSQPATNDVPSTDASDIGLDAVVDEASDDVTDATVADVLRPPPITRTQTEAQLTERRRSCEFGAGAWPAETLGTEMPVDQDIPINHVIVIMQENRSFDHYLGRLVAQGYYQPGDFAVSPDGGLGSGYAHHDQVDGPPPGWSNPDSDGTPVYPHLDDQQCYGVNHGWDVMHDQWNHGAMDHFVTNNNPGGTRAMFYEDDTVIPFYYGLATTFAIGDHYHASVLSSTWPNRYYLMAATSFGIGDNSFCTLDTGAHPVNHIFNELQRAGRSWMDYTDGPHQVLFFRYCGPGRSTTTARSVAI